MKRTKLLPAICVLTALMLLLSGCAHPWRIASNPNPATPMPDNGTDAPSTDVITSGEPADSAVPTETLTIGKEALAKEKSKNIVRPIKEKKIRRF